MTNWAEAGSARAPAASTAWSYDAVGNIQHVACRPDHRRRRVRASIVASRIAGRRSMPWGAS
ncbi:hypothetical protein AB5I41_23635 [Sphingomonas sp. MMS24-JH45]